jgi:hypothetical protein
MRYASRPPHSYWAHSTMWRELPVKRLKWNTCTSSGVIFARQQRCLGPLGCDVMRLRFGGTCRPHLQPEDGVSTYKTAWRRVTTQNTSIDSFTAVRTSNLKKIFEFIYMNYLVKTVASAHLFISDCISHVSCSGTSV